MRKGCDTKGTSTQLLSRQAKSGKKTIDHPFCKNNRFNKRKITGKQGR